MRTVLKPVALQIALAAMVLRALLPAGWMPAPITSANASPFVICTMDGPLHRTVDKQKPSSDQDRAHAPCVFASAAHLSPPLAGTVALAPSNSAAPIFFAPSRDAVVPGTHFRPNTARAPPASV
ncbi:MAG TPA: hypothetical protein VHE09_14570 [Rhizomicrobium sp.]|jgi:hypothetical protein|nr:hypothetical protein [Rhizomicrobium sp.]